MTEEYIKDVFMNTDYKMAHARLHNEIYGLMNAKKITYSEFCKLIDAINKIYDSYIQ